MTVDRLAAMEAFIRVVDAGSFSGAAKQLRLGQPAAYTRWASLRPPDAVSFKPTERNYRRSNATPAWKPSRTRAKKSLHY
jgi:Bacterial regulatory helix-turn-helix protein, lysR family